MVIIMDKKTLNIFTYYNFNEVFKAVVLFLLTLLIPVISIIIAVVNIILMMIPDYYYVIAIMIVIFTFIIAFSTRIFIDTLKHLKNIEAINYKGVYYSVFIPVTVIVSIAAFFISSLFI
jgi:hypothetical protein